MNHAHHKGPVRARTEVEAWRLPVTTQVELVDDRGYVLATYEPLGEPSRALRTVVEQVRHRARHGGLAAGKYVVRCVNDKGVSEVVRVQERVA